MTTTKRAWRREALDCYRHSTGAQIVRRERMGIVSWALVPAGYTPTRLRTDPLVQWFGHLAEAKQALEVQG